MATTRQETEDALALDGEDQVMTDAATPITTSPLHPDFLSTLHEPLQSIVGRFLGDDKGDSNESTDPSICLDRFEIQLRQETLQRVRSCWLALTEQANSSGTSMSDDTDQVAQSLDDLGSFWEQSLRLCVHLVHFSELAPGENEQQQQVDSRYTKLAPIRKQLPIILLEDMLDTLPMDACMNLWQNHVVPSFHLLFGDSLLWKPSSPAATSQTSWLPFLKLANKLLRRHMPPQQAAVLAQTMASIYPLTEKSAYKLWGSHNTETVTEFESLEQFQIQQQEEEQPMEMEQQGAATSSSSSSSQTADYSFYQAFWKLQHDFSNPYAVSVADFIQRLGTFFKALQSHKVISAPAVSDSSSSQQHAMSTVATTSPYLTSSRLLPLQLQDVDFRIHVLTQFLLAAHHLTSQVASLGPRLQEFVQTAKQLLVAIPVVGVVHLEVVESILATLEPQWRRWKQNRCTPDLDVPKTKITTGTKTTSSSRTGTKRKREPSQLEPEEDESDDLPSSYQLIVVQKDLPALSSKIREVVPTVQDHLSDYVEALDPESGIEDQYHPRNDKLFTWRAFRLLAAEHLEDFEMIGPNGDLEPAIRRIYKEQKGVDIPGSGPVYDEYKSEEEEDVEQDQVALQEEAVPEQNENEGDEAPASEQQDDHDATDMDEAKSTPQVKDTFDSVATSPMDEEENISYGDMGTVVANGTSNTEKVGPTKEQANTENVTPAKRSEVGAKSPDYPASEPNGKDTAKAASHHSLENHATKASEGSNEPRSSSSRSRSPPTASRQEASKAANSDGNRSQTISPGRGSSSRGPEQEPPKASPDGNRSKSREDDRLRHSSDRVGRRGGAGEAPRDDRRGGAGDGARDDRRGGAGEAPRDDRREGPGDGARDDRRGGTAEAPRDDRRGGAADGARDDRRGGDGPRGPVEVPRGDRNPEPNDRRVGDGPRGPDRRSGDGPRRGPETDDRRVGGGGGAGGGGKGGAGGSGGGGGDGPRAPDRRDRGGRGGGGGGNRQRERRNGGDGERRDDARREGDRRGGDQNRRRRG